MPLESYFILIPLFILIALIFGEKLFIYLFIVIICFVFYIFKQQIDMELKLLKEKRKNESNEIYMFYEEFQQQRFQEDDTLNNNSSNLSSNGSRNFSSSSRGKIIQRINIPPSRSNCSRPEKIRTRVSIKDEMRHVVPNCLLL